MPKRKPKTRAGWRTSAELEFLLGSQDLPPVESLSREAWAIERGHFERLLSAYQTATAGDRDLAGLEGREEPQPAVINGAAIIPLHGVLSPSLPWYRLGTSTEKFALQFVSAMDNAEVERIIIRINSPGGTAQGCAELSDLIYRSRGRKPITAWAVNGLMASAAYFVGSAADQVISTPSSLIGSIGVMMAHFDTVGMAEQMGLVVTVLAQPDRKKLGTEHEPLTDEKQKQLHAEILAPYYAQFISHVARNRGVTEDAVRAGFGRGGVLIASEAQTAGMVDRVGDWNALLRELSGREPPASRTVFLVRSATQDGKAGTSVPAVDAQASAIVADAHDTPDGSVTPSTTLLGDLTVKYSQQTLALLFGAGIISAMDAPTDSVTAAVQGFCAARGLAVPSEEAELCKLIKAGIAPIPVAVLAERVAQPLAAATPPPPDATVIRDAIAAERTRVSGIEARAQCLGLDPASDQVRAAIANGTPVADFVNATVTAAVEQNRPIQQVGARGRIDPGPAALDNFTASAVDALLLRSQSRILAQARAADPHQAGQAEEQTRDAIVAQTRQNQQVRDIASMSWPDIVRTAVELSGVRVLERTPVGLATAFLSLGGSGRRPFAVGHNRIDGSAVGAWLPALEGPGDYPSIMDGLANRVVMFATQMAPVTYMSWAGRIADLQNFQPREVVTFGQFGELPLHVDGRPYEQSALPNEAAWLQADEYGDEFVLTPRMILQDPMDTLIRGLTSKQIAHERTLNRLCVNLLTGNVTSPTSGLACYSNTNDVNYDGGPSVSAFTSMRKLLNQQTRVGGTEEAGLDLAVIITGSEWITAAQIVCWDVPGQNRVPAQLVDANPFTFIRPLYDPMVSGASADGLTWYGTADPALLPGIVYGFIAGYGPGGRRTTYFNPSTGAQHFQFQGAFGAALLHHESLVRADGAGTTTTTTTT